MSTNPAKSLYRLMLRAAKLVPHDNKRALATDRIRNEFRSARVNVRARASLTTLIACVGMD